MRKWTKEDALEYIEMLINSIPQIKINGRKSSEHLRWLLNTLKFLGNIFGENSIYYTNINHLPWSETGSMIISDPRSLQGEMLANHNSAFIRQMEQAKGFLLSAKDQLENSQISDVFEYISESTNNLLIVLKIGETKLRKVIRDVPTLEKEIQDNYENLLIGSEINYKREYPHIQYSSKQYIPDFSFPDLDLIVEIKLSKSDEKKLISQLNDDILAYKTKFTNIIFVIYDLGTIRDIDSFKNSFETQENVFVQIIKH